MSISTPFIKRPVATSLLTFALALAGGSAFYFSSGRAGSAGGVPDDQCECKPAGSQSRRRWPRR